MKTRDIALQYNIDKVAFEEFLDANKISCSTNFFTGTVDVEGDIEEYVRQFKIFVEKQKQEKQENEQTINEAQQQEELKRKEREALQNAEEEKKQKALANMLITSGFNFDGYRIKKYSGYISGDDAISVGRGTLGFFSNATDVGQSLTASLAKIRRRAIQELKEAAYDLGCNAVIGVDFDYITLEPETASSTGGTVYLPYVFCVTANGNAVIIEKDDEK